MVQIMGKPGEALTCGQVDAPLASCNPYLMNGGSPAPACCDGVKNLKDITPTVADRRAACDCVKSAAARYLDIKEDVASPLPATCRVQTNIPICKTSSCAQ